MWYAFLGLFFNIFILLFFHSLSLFFVCMDSISMVAKQNERDHKLHSTHLVEFNGIFTNSIQWDWKDFFFTSVCWKNSMHLFSFMWNISRSLKVDRTRKKNIRKTKLIKWWSNQPNSSDLQWTFPYFFLLLNEVLKIQIESN